MNLTQRLFALAFVALLPAIAIQTYNEFALRDAREKEVRESARRSALLAASEINFILDGVRQLLTAVANVEGIRTLDPIACNAYLATLAPQTPTLLVIGAVDRDGRVLCNHASTTIPETVADRPYFQAALGSGGFAIGEYTLGRYSKKPVLPVALPIKGPEGRPLGALVASIDLTWLTARLAERGVPRGGSLTVADRNGVILAREPFPERFVGTRIPEEFRHLIDAPAAGAVEIRSQDGTPRVLGYVPAALQPEGIYVSAGLSSDESYAAVERSNRRGLIMIGLGILLAMAAAWAAGRYFVKRPVARLLDAARAWQGGNWSIRTGGKAREGEFEALGEAFDRVVEEVARREDALRESEQRIQIAVAAGRMGTWWLDPARGRGGFSARSFEILGLDRRGAEVTIDEWFGLIHPDDRPAAVAEFRRALAEGGSYEAECRIVRPLGGIRWVNSRGIVEREGGRATRMVGVLMDVTERRENEAHQRLLLDELNHRVKNTLATVQSIALQTLRTAPSLAAFGEDFESRLIALSRTHDLLTRRHWQQAGLLDLLRAELAPYRRDDKPRYELHGPETELPPRSALVLGLVFHELTTNAVKYGALSRPEGRIRVEWRVRPQGDGGHVLALDWVETGGPAVEPPRRKGFGSRLIERSIGAELGGTVVLQFRPDGVVAALTVPLAGEPAAIDPADEGKVESRPAA